MSPDEAEDKASALAARVLRRRFAVGFASLSEPDKRVYCVYIVELEVKNGGLLQFLANADPEALVVTPAALRAVGATRTATVIESAYAQVFKGALPRTEAERDRRLAVIAEEDLRGLIPLDEAFYQTGEHLCSLLVANVETSS